jgi:glutaredoxin
MAEIKVYGADWCSMTQRALYHLKEKKVPFTYINVEKDPEASEWVRAQNDGKERKPTISIGETILVEPTNQELDEALQQARA